MRYWLKREWDVLLSKDTFMLELFLLFYSLIYALVWIWPSETFSLDAYQWLRGVIDETTLGVIVFCVSFAGLFCVRKGIRAGRIFSMIFLMIFWLCLGAAFLIATPVGATGFGFLFCGIAAGWVSARLQ